ncbi:hypothetical protein F5Y15DRAFT_373540 [Xylariaceae sp. FL0016]|nr:hypothetical protein F5Y15DRAFT_373540 [Xylariaceae sp. FL0016]
MNLNTPNFSDAAQQVAEICSISLEEAGSRLQANQFTVERALDEFFQDPTSNKYKWDEDAFNTDRQGEAGQMGASQMGGCSFNIQGPDELPAPESWPSAAPTRPPSRTNARSPLGRLVDFTAQEAAGAPTNAAQADQDLARALAESAFESGLPPQEAGIVESDLSKHFGPANRPEYDSEQWAMVPTKVDAQATFSDSEPPPSKRKRCEDSPSFLRQTKDYHRIGSLLTIYHKIPLARNILLQLGPHPRTYGHNTEWWRGQAILKAETLAALTRGDPISNADSYPDFIEEVHRLLGFLDRTDRSYGTADTVVESDAIDSSHGRWPPDVEEKIFEALNHHARISDIDISSLVTTGKLLREKRRLAHDTLPSSDADEEEADQEEVAEIMCLDVHLPSDRYQYADTLYDILDHFLWSKPLSLDTSFSDSRFNEYAVLSKASEVLTIRIGGSGLTKPCDIPGVFYADRYMADRKESAVHFQIQMREIMAGLQRLTESESRRSRCTDKHGCRKLLGLDWTHDVRSCSQKIISLAEDLLDRQKRDVQWRHFECQWTKEASYSMSDLSLIHSGTGPVELTADDEEDKARWENIIQKSKDAIALLDQDLAECKLRQEECAGFLEVIRKRLTCQEHEVDNELYVFRSNPEAYRPDYWNPKHKYTLRGVALTKELAYVCVREPADLMDLGDTATPIDQWWKIGFAPNDANPVTTEKVTMDDALAAAGTGSRNPVLVYATEPAMQAEPMALSDSLRMFVKADNRSFQQELAQEQNQGSVHDRPTHNVQQPGLHASALSHVPVEEGLDRPHHGGSSVATNGSDRSNLDDVDLNFSDDLEPFVKEANPSSSHEEYAAQEMTELGSGFKGPEMQERGSGFVSLLTRPGNDGDEARQSPIDLMDLDLKGG